MRHSGSVSSRPCLYPPVAAGIGSQLPHRGTVLVEM